MDFVCLLFAVFFAVFAMVFGLLKGKATILISGFNDLPKEDRDCYDKARLAKDIRNLMLALASITGVGAVLCHFVSQYFAAAAFVGVMILLFRNVHLDTDTAFGKYRLK